MLMPYCHADYAWLHTRDWHKRRYLMVFDKVLELLRQYPSYHYFFDSLSEFFNYCISQRQDSIPFVRQMLKEGRLAFTCGHWSNIRFTQVGDETSIRNLIIGKRAVKRIFPEAVLNVYANLDVGIGHSQLPQLLILAGCNGYMAWRPQKGLDDQGVPRAFHWKGLSGAEITVSRHPYQGWFHAEEFCQKPESTTDLSSLQIDFEHTVKYAWQRYLEVPVNQGRKTVSFCQGSDDLLPNSDAFYGGERDIIGLVQKWNDAGYGKMSFATPNKLFAELKQEQLKIVEGVLDQCDVCFNVAQNGKQGVWSLREKSDKALLLAEHCATAASIQGAYDYPAEKLNELWKRHLKFCTHAIEFTFEDDFKKATSTLLNVIEEASEIIKTSLATMLCDTQKNDPESISFYNSLPENFSRVLQIELPNIDNARRMPILSDMNGNRATTQIVYVGGLSRDFTMLVESEFASGSFSSFKIGWDNQEPNNLPSDEPLESLDIVLESDVIRLQFENGNLIIAENKLTGIQVESEHGSALLEPLSLNQEMSYWMPESFAESPSPFITKSLVVAEKGPLRWRIIRTGTSGKHSFTQYFDLIKGASHVEVKTVADLCYDSVMICLGMPLDKSNELTVDIPFGVEKRDLDNIKYRHKGEGNYENIERRIPGLFWGRSWAFVENGNASYGLINLDGARYYRRYGSPERLLHFLACLRPDRTSGWMTKTDSQRACGRNVFKHWLVLDDTDWQRSKMVQKSQLAGTVMPTMFGHPKDSSQGLNITPSTVRLSAYHKEGDNIIVRVVNMSDDAQKTSIVLPCDIFNVCKTDLLGEPMQKILEISDSSFSDSLTPWEIATFRVSIVNKV